MTQLSPKISIVIPVKNGAPWLEECLSGIFGQSLYGCSEIIAIDSGSTDGSLEILKKYPVRLYKIPSSEFNHGLTRNYGVQLSRGEFVVMTVQDAKPFNSEWLQELLNGFTDDKVAGVGGIQVVPHSNHTNPVDWFRPVGEPEKKRIDFTSAEEFHSLTPFEKMSACSWDDVTAMYRRSVLEEIPFQKISYGEDAIWAREALLSGYSLVYNPAARVYHFHKEDEEFTFRRTLTVMHLRYRQFGCLYNRPQHNLRQRLSIFKTIMMSSPLSINEKWFWHRYNRRQLRGQQKAFDVFMAALAKGEQELDAVHEKYCGKPPIPLKPVLAHESTTR